MMRRIADTGTHNDIQGIHQVPEWVFGSVQKTKVGVYYDLLLSFISTYPDPRELLEGGSGGRAGVGSGVGGVGVSGVTI